MKASGKKLATFVSPLSAICISLLFFARFALYILELHVNAALFDRIDEFEEWTSNNSTVPRRLQIGHRGWSSALQTSAISFPLPLQPSQKIPIEVIKPLNFESIKVNRLRYLVPLIGPLKAINVSSCCCHVRAREYRSRSNNMLQDFHLLAREIVNTRSCVLRSGTHT